MGGTEDRDRLLFKADRAVGRHLFLLGVLLLFVIVLALTAPAVVALYAISQGQPWWMAVGATVLTLAGVGAALQAVPRILGPEGVTGIVRQRNNSPALPQLHSEKDDDGASPPTAAVT